MLNRNEIVCPDNVMNLAKAAVLNVLESKIIDAVAAGKDKIFLASGVQTGEENDVVNIIGSKLRNLDVYKEYADRLNVTEDDFYTNVTAEIIKELKNAGYICLFRKTDEVTVGYSKRISAVVYWTRSLTAEEKAEHERKVSTGEEERITVSTGSFYLTW